MNATTFFKSFATDLSWVVNHPARRNKHLLLFGLKIFESAIASMLPRAAERFAECVANHSETVHNSPVIASDGSGRASKARRTGSGRSRRYGRGSPDCTDSRKIVPTEFLDGARPSPSDHLFAQCNHAEAHHFSLAHLIRDARYAINAGNTVFAPAFKTFLQRACDIGRRRPDPPDATIKAYAHTLARELSQTT